MDDAGESPKPKKKGLMVPLLVGVILAAGGGGGGYWAVTSGPFAPDAPPAGDAATADAEGAGQDAAAAAARAAAVEVSFIELETLVIALGSEQSGRSLIFSAALEVRPEDRETVALLTPRVMDVLNSYLRVISVSELSEPASLARLRAQLLRRIQVVTGSGLVRDLLVTQFLVN